MLGVAAGVDVELDEVLESFEEPESLEPFDEPESPCDVVELALILPWLVDRESLR